VTRNRWIRRQGVATRPPALSVVEVRAKAANDDLSEVN